MSVKQKNVLKLFYVLCLGDIITMGYIGMCSPKGAIKVMKSSHHLFHDQASKRHGSG